MKAPYLSRTTTQFLINLEARRVKKGRVLTILMRILRQGLPTKIRAPFRVLIAKPVKMAMTTFCSTLPSLCVTSRNNNKLKSHSPQK